MPTIKILWELKFKYSCHKQNAGYKYLTTWVLDVECNFHQHNHIQIIFLGFRRTEICKRLNSPCHHNMIQLMTIYMMHFEHTLLLIFNFQSWHSTVTWPHIPPKMHFINKLWYSFGLGLLTRLYLYHSVPFTHIILAMLHIMCASMSNYTTQFPDITSNKQIFQLITVFQWIKYFTAVSII